jgi:hypothetical protein
VWPVTVWANRLADAPSSRQIGRDRARVVLTAMCHSGKWVDDRFLVTVSTRVLTDWCPPEYGRRTVREVLDLLEESGHIRCDGTAGKQGTRYEVVTPADLRPSSGQASGQASGRASGRASPPTGFGLGNGLGGGKGEAVSVDGQVPVPGGAGLPPPTKSEFSKTNPDIDPGCPRHGWETHGVDPCGGCRDANQRKAGHAEQARAALEAERAAYRAAVAVADWCGHEDDLEPGGHIPQPRGCGPRCWRCRKQWERDRAPAPERRERIAADVIPTAGLGLDKYLSALQIAG